MMEPAHGSGSRAWSWRHAVAKSGLPSNTRLVLLTLSLKMDETGGSCYPPITELVELSGLDKKTVLKHLEIAEDKGWIEVSQHGYRGQKWKRNEYVARWPGRDLVGESAKADDEKGGGAVPPPSEEKVVELSPEGGGTVSQKVVEQLHQDKTLPANSPSNVPAAGAGEGDLNRADRKKIEHAFTIWFAAWDKGDVEFARNAWFAMPAEDRAECVEKTPEVLRWTKKDDRSAAAVYLKGRQWRDIIAALPPESDRSGLHNAFSRAWSAKRIMHLLANPSEPPVPPTRFQLMQLQQGGEAAEKIRLERRLAYGWPKVMTMHQRAQMAEGVTVAPWLVKLSENFVSYHKDSAEALRWKAYHQVQGWPWLPVPASGVDWLYFPPGEPEQAVAEFSDAIMRERGNDDAA